VSLQITNSGGHHRFGLRAVPPANLAGPLDVRGDLTGTTVRALAEWNGKLYLALDYADIAAWRTGVPFPIELSGGRGGVRVGAVSNRAFTRQRRCAGLAHLQPASIERSDCRCPAC